MKSIFLLLALLVLTVVMTTAQPAIEWQKCLGGTNQDDANSIQQTKDGGYIVAGSSRSNDGDVTANHGSYDYWIVKLDSAGAIQWQKSLGGTGGDYERSIQQTKDGGYIVAGCSISKDGDVTGNLGSYDYWIVKLDSVGAIQWQKSLGGTNEDEMPTIQQTKEGGYIVAGFSKSNDGDVTGNHNSWDYWIVKLDSASDILWQKSFGGSEQDYVRSIQQTTDGGYIVAGYSYSNDGDVTGNHGSADYWLVKLDSTGSIQWQKSLGGRDDDEAESIQQTTDGGYIVAGYSWSNNGNVTFNQGYSDYWIVKLDSIGSIQWQKSLGGTANDYVASIQQTKDGGYIVAGYSYSNDGDVTGNHGSADYWLVKLDSTGAFQWQQSLGGTGDDEAFSIQQTTDGGYIVAGYSNSNDGDVTGNHGGGDCWIVKLSPEDTVGIKEPLTKENSLMLYPNPASEQLTIRTSSFHNEETTITIMNLLGEIQQQETVKANNLINLNIINLNAGIYFLQMKSANTSLVNPHCRLNSKKQPKILTKPSIYQQMG